MAVWICTDPRRRKKPAGCPSAGVCRVSRCLLSSMASVTNPCSMAKIKKLAVCAGCSSLNTHVAHAGQKFPRELKVMKAYAPHGRQRNRCFPYYRSRLCAGCRGRAAPVVAAADGGEAAVAVWTCVGEAPVTARSKSARSRTPRRNQYVCCSAYAGLRWRSDHMLVGSRKTLRRRRRRPWRDQKTGRSRP
jgi:hypothetical protein